MPFGDLLASDERIHKVEIQWRLSKVAIVPVLAILALAFSSLDVRRGRLGRIMGAIGMYFLYSNLLGFAHALLKSGKMPVFMGMWWVHAIFLRHCTLYAATQNGQSFDDPGSGQATSLMNILDWYLGRTIFKYTSIVMFVLVGLFMFIQFLDEITRIGTGNYGFFDMLIYLVLSTPRVIYEIFPMSALLGTMLGIIIACG